MKQPGTPRVIKDDSPAGGWGSTLSVGEILHREGRLLQSPSMLYQQNKPDGFACSSCAWAKPGDPRPLEVCENGAKATAWEATAHKCTREFFATYTIDQLKQWPDYDLEEQGRLTEPLRWDATSNRYQPVSWEAAFAEIGKELQAVDPDSTIFYASGRASLEASYLYQLLARLYGTNNLPDSSNMCHESTSIALPESLGDAVGTVTLEDFAETECILFFGQNPGSNSPRMLHPLQEARERDVPIITFNPLKERGLEAFVNPQSPKEMLTNHATKISTQYHQVSPGGDMAALTGMCKWLVEQDEAALALGDAALLDHDFIKMHCHGFDELKAFLKTQSWENIERHAGIDRAAIESAAKVYANAKSTIAVYGMGLTQHRHGVETIQMLVNLLLLRGNIGRGGAGICPVRGHSNVQGQRTVGITEKPELAPLDQLAERFRFQPPRQQGRNTVEACEGILDGSVRAFISLGGNFIRAIPETKLMEKAWEKLRLSVQIATKLNRSHLVHAEVSFILPCLGHTEIDRQNGIEQIYTTEDSMGYIHGWHGKREPASPELLSEPAIVAGIAKATLPESGAVEWDGWIADYSKIRDEIALSYPAIFQDFNHRLTKPTPFHRPIGAARRNWQTDNGKANFITPDTLNEDNDLPTLGDDVLTLMTLRSNDQFNTTIYGYHDRFRGIQGTRAVILMNQTDIERLNLQDGDQVKVSTAAGDNVERSVGPLRVTEYNIPKGSCGAYYPECNPLMPLWHHAARSKVPAAKSVPVRIELLKAA